MSKIVEVSRMVHNLRNIEYNQNVGGWNYLMIPSSQTKGVLPAFVQVMSHHTGKIVKFQPIRIDHPKFDQDHWDGEQQIYEPIDATDINHSNLLLVVSHGY